MKRLMVCLLCLMMIFANASAEEGTWIVNNPHSTWVHLRKESTTKSQSLGRYPNGTELSLLGQTDNGWYQVEVEGKTGYMLTGMVTRIYSLSDECRIVGRAVNGDHIMACSAPNGQTLYFTTIEKNPHLKMEDVNFDGVSDIVVFTSMGASNHFCEFFVFDDVHREYRMAEYYGAENGLPNYQLLPEKGLVTTHANNGSAGALHEKCIFRWDGNDLKLIRKALSEELTETDFQQDRFVTTTYTQKLHVTVRDYTTSEYEGTVIWEETAELDESTIRDLMERENEALWEGL